MKDRMLIWIAVQIVFLLGMAGGAVMILYMQSSPQEPMSEKATQPNKGSFLECFAIPGPFARACNADKLIDQVTAKSDKPKTEAQE
jgi:flagellar basal body-associated protein FliL